MIPELQKSEAEMKKVISRMASEFSALRTGRAHVSLLEGIKLDYYGSLLPIHQVANIAIVDARTLEIKPWDKEALLAVEQAIIKSDLGIHPQSDGKVIRITLPALTEERRRDLTRLARKQAEDFRVAVRNIRRESVEELKKQEKDKKISKDDLFKLEQAIQKLTDQYIKNVDDLLTLKEKEILEV